MDPQALWLTLRLAATTTIILLVVAIPLSWWISSGRGAFRAIVQAVLALPLVLPPTVISFAGLVVGSVLYSVPFAIMPLVAGFQAIGPEYVEAASLLGANPVRSFFDVTLPLAKPAVLSATVLVFLHTVGEFGVVLMLGGNIPGSTQTLSIALFDQVQDGNYAAANNTALLLIAFAVIGLVLVYARRPWRPIA